MKQCRILYCCEENGAIAGVLYHNKVVCFPPVCVPPLLCVSPYLCPGLV